MAILIALGAWQIIELNTDFSDYREFKPKMMILSKELLQLNDSLKNDSKISISEYNTKAETYYKDIFSNYADSLMNEKLQFYSNQLENIKKQIVVENKKLSEIKINRQRALNGLPETISLDELYSKYKKNRTESFYTSKGRIAFLLNDFSFLTVPSTREVAYIRIGKENSSENSALINAFLDESAKSKIKQGYRLISNKTYPADYGKYKIKKYKKGDSYFLTFYQFTRHQGTYNSTYFRYKYYIEIGSTKRKEQFENEQFNSKLGS